MSIERCPTRVSVSLDKESIAFTVLRTSGVAFLVSFTYSWNCFFKEGRKCLVLSDSGSSSRAFTVTDINSLES